MNPYKRIALLFLTIGILIFFYVFTINTVGLSFLGPKHVFVFALGLGIGWGYLAGYRKPGTALSFFELPKGKVFTILSIPAGVSNERDVQMLYIHVQDNDSGEKYFCYFHRDDVKENADHIASGVKITWKWEHFVHPVGAVNKVKVVYLIPVTPTRSGSSGRDTRSYSRFLKD